MVNTGAIELAKTLRLEPRAWTAEELVTRWGRATLRSATRQGLVERVLPAIYAASEHAESLVVRAHAAHLWCGADSVLVGQGEASVWGLCDAPQSVVMATHYGVANSPAPWLTLRRMGVAPPHAYWFSCPVAMPEWAAVTAYAMAHKKWRDGYLYRVVQSGRASPTELLAVAAALPRLPGRRHLEDVVAAIRAGSESHLETTGLRRVFNTADFAGFIRQHWVRTPGGNYRLDMFEPNSRTAVELDGREPHDGSEARQYDITRDIDVASMGILTARLSHSDIHERPQWCREKVLAIVSSRSGARTGPE